MAPQPRLVAFALLGTPMEEWPTELLEEIRVISPDRLIPEEYVYYAHSLEECVVPAVKLPVWANTTTRWGANYFAALEEQWLKEWNTLMEDIPKRRRLQEQHTLYFNPNKPWLLYERARTYCFSIRPMTRLAYLKKKLDQLQTNHRPNKTCARGSPVLFKSKIGRP